MEEGFSDNPRGGLCCIVISILFIFLTLFTDPLGLIAAVPSAIISILYYLFNRGRYPSSDTFYQEKKNQGF